MQSVHRTFGAVAVVAACATMGCTTETTSSAGGEPESSSTLEDGLTAGAPMTSRPTRLLARFPASATTKQQTGGAVVNWELYPQYSANHFDYPSGAGVLMGYILVGADASGRARVAAVASGHFAPVAGAPRATSGTRIRGTPLIGTTMSARGGSAKRATETVWMPAGAFNATGQQLFRLAGADAKNNAKLAHANAGDWAAVGGGTLWALGVPGGQWLAAAGGLYWMWANRGSFGSALNEAFGNPGGGFGFPPHQCQTQFSCGMPVGFGPLTCTKQTAPGFEQASCATWTCCGI